VKRKKLFNIPSALLLRFFSQHETKMSLTVICGLYDREILLYIQSFNNLSDDTSKASSKTVLLHRAIKRFLLQMRLSSPVLKVIQ